MKKIVAILVLALSAGSAAQAGLALGERPIARGEVISTVKKQFVEMDRNRNGSVSYEEFEAYREVQNAQPDRGRGLTHIGRSWFDKSDEDGDGRVSAGEAQGRPLQMFDMADMDRDGVASISEQSMAALFIK